MKNQATWIWLGLGAGALAGLYYLQSQGILPAPAAATPLSIYPELAYTQTKTTSMAASPTQQNTTTVVPPTPYFTSVQQAEQAAIYGQCVGAAVCSPLSGDMQLGF